MHSQDRKEVLSTNPETLIQQRNEFGSYNESCHKQGPHPPPLPHVTSLRSPRGQPRPGGPQGEHYLEGLQLALHLLAEALAVLPQLPLFGGLGSGVLKLSFQLEKGRSAFIKPQYRAVTRNGQRGASNSWPSSHPQELEPRSTDCKGQL